MAMKIEDVRRWNARALADAAGGLVRFAEMLDRAQPQISHIIGRNPSKAIERVQARYIESKTGKPDGWLDVPHVRDWMSIQNQRWLDELRSWMLANGVEVKVDPDAVGPEADLVTLFSVLSDIDKARLIEIARLLARGPGSA